MIASSASFDSRVRQRLRPSEFAGLLMLSRLPVDLPNIRRQEIILFGIDGPQDVRPLAWADNPPGVEFRTEIICLEVEGSDP